MDTQAITTILSFVATVLFMIAISLFSQRQLDAMRQQSTRSDKEAYYVEEQSERIQAIGQLSSDPSPPVNPLIIIVNPQEQRSSPSIVSISE